MGKGVSVGRSEGSLYISADFQGKVFMKVSQAFLSSFPREVARTSLWTGLWGRVMAYRHWTCDRDTAT